MKTIKDVLVNFDFQAVGADPESTNEEIIKQALADIEAICREVIGETREYSKLEMCPTCSQRQYSCSCDVAEELLINKQLARLKQLIGEDD